MRKAGEKQVWKRKCFGGGSVKSHSVSGGKVVNVCQNILEDTDHFKPADPPAAMYLGKIAS